jgi:hypothetical protein
MPNDSTKKNRNGKSTVSEIGSQRITMHKMSIVLNGILSSSFAASVIWAFGQLFFGREIYGEKSLFGQVGTGKPYCVLKQ